MGQTQGKDGTSGELSHCFHTPLDEISGVLPPKEKGCAGPVPSKPWLVASRLGPVCLLPLHLLFIDEAVLRGAVEAFCKELVRSPAQLVSWVTR